MDRTRRHGRVVERLTAATEAVDSSIVRSWPAAPAASMIAAGQDVDRSAWPFDAPYSGRRRALTGGDDRVGGKGDGKPSTEPDAAAMYLERLSTELGRREWLVLLCVQGGEAVLHVAHPVVHCVTDHVLCRQSADGEWQFVWSGSDFIGPVDDVTGAADRIVQRLRVVGAAGGER